MTSATVRAPEGQPTLRSLLETGTIHFMGIGGAGMCALAEAVVREGGRVTGCDTAPGEGARRLERMGVRVREGHDPSHLDGVVALVVSAAIPRDHPEIAAARATATPTWTRAAALAEWVDQGEVVAVAGTHGKTTTTAMITDILSAAGRDPTGFVGGTVVAWGGNLRAGGSELFIVEADEFDRSFHHLSPSVALVTNVEADHLDIYGDMDGVREGFGRFLDGVREGGLVLACSDSPALMALLAGRLGVRTYGFAATSDLRATTYTGMGSGGRFDVEEDGASAGAIELPMAGRHNAVNALGAAAVSRALGVGWDVIRSALADFSGILRRFQVLGEAASVRVVDDYAPHPSEIDAAIAAARDAFPGARLVVAFQPHLFTRTRDFAAGFGRSLAAADEVWITDIYPAREAPIPGVDGTLVARELRGAAEAHSGPEGGVHVHRDLGTLARELVERLRPGDVCLTLGAGSIERVAPEVLRRLAGRASEGAHA